MPGNRRNSNNANHHSRWTRNALGAALAGLLIVQSHLSAAQSMPQANGHPLLHRVAISSARVDGDPGAFQAVQFMPEMMTPMQPMIPAMPGIAPAQMPGMPGMGAPPMGSGSGMGGGMAMVMTGESMMEMVAGACAAGLFVGGIAAATATAPFAMMGAGAPVTATSVVYAAGAGCAFAVAATVVGMGGMMAWRAAAGGM